MLSKNLKRAGAIIPATAILCTSAVIPVMAKTATTTTKQVTTSVISENFDSYEIHDYKDLNNTEKTFEANSNISYRQYVSWEYNRKMSIEADDTDGKDGNVLAFDNNSGIRLNFANPQGSTPVEEGDVVTISFRYKFATNKQKININLNDNTSGRYTAKGGKSNISGAAGYGSKSWSGTSKSRLAVLDLDAGGNDQYSDMSTYHVSDDKYREETITKNAWHTMTITINTKDSSQGNNQTIKIANDDTYLYGLYDANYTGADDNTYDRFTEVTSFQLDTKGCGSRTDGATDYISIDDVSVTVSGMREVTEYQSELNTMLINEDFSGLTASGYNGWNADKDNRKELAGTSFKYDTYGADGSMSNTYNTEEKALNIRAVTGNDHHFVLFADCAATLLNSGDIINMSFDYYETRLSKMYVMLQGLEGKGVLYKTISSKDWYGTSEGLVEPTDSKWQGVQNKEGATDIDKNARIATTGVQTSGDYERADMFAPVFAHTGNNATKQYSFTPGNWYTIEISIDTKNEKFDDKQTMSLKYKKRGEATYSQEYFGYLDTDDTTVGIVDALTSFKGFDIGITTFKNADSDTADTNVYIDNVKASVQRPGYEAWGAASEGHETDGKFTAGQNMSIKAAADPALFKTVTTNEETGAVTIADKSVPMMLAAALYDSSDRFMGVKLAEKTLSAADPYIETAEFSTTGVTKVRTFLWEKSNIAPYLDFGTFTAGAAD